MQEFRILLFLKKWGYLLLHVIGAWNNLKDQKVIKNFSTNLNLEKIGYPVLVMVNISLKGQSANMLHEFEKEVKKFSSSFLFSTLWKQ